MSESESLAEAISLMPKLAADVLMLAPGVHLNVDASAPATAAESRADIAVIQEAPPPRETYTRRARARLAGL